MTNDRDAAIRQALAVELGAHPESDEWDARYEIPPCSYCRWSKPQHSQTCPWTIATRLLPVVRRLVDEAQGPQWQPMERKD